MWDVLLNPDSPPDTQHKAEMWEMDISPEWQKADPSNIKDSFQWQLIEYLCNLNLQLFGIMSIQTCEMQESSHCQSLFHGLEFADKNCKHRKMEVHSMKFLGQHQVWLATYFLFCALC